MVDAHCCKSCEQSTHMYERDLAPQRVQLRLEQPRLLPYLAHLCEGCRQSELRGLQVGPRRLEFLRHEEDGSG